MRNKQENSSGWISRKRQLIYTDKDGNEKTQFETSTKDKKLTPPEITPIVSKFKLSNDRSLVGKHSTNSKEIEELKEEAVLLKKAGQLYAVKDIEDVEYVLYMYYVGKDLFNVLKKEEEIIESNLNNHKHKRSPLTSVNIKSIIAGALQWLANLHDLGITHADIKLENITYSRTTKKTTVIDLGQAFLDEDNVGKEERRGTVKTMAPEVLLADKPLLTKASDIYSMGITLLEFLENYLYIHGKIEQEAILERNPILVNDVEMEYYVLKPDSDLPENLAIILSETLKITVAQANSFIDLLKAMVNVDPKKRPTAAQVVKQYTNIIIEPEKTTEETKKAENEDQRHQQGKAERLRVEQAQQELRRKEEQHRQQAEQELRRQEEELRRQQEEQEQRRKEEQRRQQAEQELRRKEEQRRQQEEQELRRKEEQRRQQEEQELRRKEEEQQRHQQEEQELRRKEEGQRRKEEELRRQQQEELHRRLLLDEKRRIERERRSQLEQAELQAREAELCKIKVERDQEEKARRANEARQRQLTEQQRQLEEEKPVKKQLGAGTTSIVYKILSSSSEKQQVEKIVRIKDSAHKLELENKAALLKQAGLLSGTKETPQFYVFYMPYYGKSLSKVLIKEQEIFKLPNDKTPPLTGADIKNIMADVLTDLARLHELNIIPANIPVENIAYSRKTKKAKLIGLGLACFANATLEEKDKKTPTQESNVHSMGITLLDLLKRYLYAHGENMDGGIPKAAILAKRLEITVHQANSLINLLKTMGDHEPKNNKPTAEQALMQYRACMNMVDNSSSIKSINQQGVPIDKAPETMPETEKTSKAKDKDSQENYGCFGKAFNFFFSPPCKHQPPLAGQSLVYRIMHLLRHH